MSTLLDQIKQEIEPMRVLAVSMAEEIAKREIEAVWKGLEEVNWDRQAYAPYPSSRLSRPAYKQAQYKYMLVNKITQSVEAVTNPNEPVFCKKRPEGVKRLMKETKDAAEASFLAYAKKLEAKIGMAQRVTLTPTNRGLWEESYLRVQMMDGTTELWKTQTIVNQSCLGKLFFQFPTRKVKVDR